MKKIINPCICGCFRYLDKTLQANAFVKIEFENGKLSISGVIGPKTNGDCWGSCGQCTDEIRQGTPKENWSKEMLNKLCDIWDEWHLNDMRPYCKHQKELGWDKKANKKVTLYHYTLTAKALKEKNDVEKLALEMAKQGKTFTPTREQIIALNREYFKTSWKEIDDENYQPKKSLYNGDGGSTEIKTLGWLRESDHPDGILSKECPVCGYKYGSAWIKEDVPKEVIDWLFALPDTKVKPAWI